ncbi:transposase [Phycisphaera mikurensis]|nr:transposase [Phycisphaera mikurensis]MBB6443408.1 putative transposase [Phycisphaera mikurensis]
MNRGNGRLTIFADDADFLAFEAVLERAAARFPQVEILAYCLMPNHWHLVLRPREDGVLSRFMAWLTLTHTKRWHMHQETSGEGHLYQGRFRSFIVQPGEHFVKVCRYVERNALRAGLVAKAEHWRWGSLWRWHGGTLDQTRLLSGWPEPPGRRPPGWVERVNRPQSPKELEVIRLSIARGRPLGDPAWRDVTIKQYGLESTMRSRGGQRKVG